jgi:hypothetical protein
MASWYDCFMPSVLWPNILTSRRLDLVGRSFFDSPPLFAMPTEIYCQPSNFAELSSSLQETICELKFSHPEMLSTLKALARMSSIAHTVNLHSSDLGFWQGEVAAVHLLGPMIHDLLSLPRLEDIPERCSDAQITAEMVRLTCLMLLSQLKRRFSLNYSDFKPLTKKMLLLLPASGKIGTEKLTGLLLWALVSSALVQNLPTMREYVSSIRRMALQSGCANIKAALQLPKDVLSFDVLTDSSAQDLERELNRAWNATTEDRSREQCVG